MYPSKTRPITTRAITVLGTELSPCGQVPPGHPGEVGTYVAPPRRARSTTLPRREVTAVVTYTVPRVGVVVARTNWHASASRPSRLCTCGKLLEHLRKIGADQIAALVQVSGVPFVAVAPKVGHPLAHIPAVAVLSEATGDGAANRRRADIPGHMAVVQPCEPSFLRQSITSPLAFSVPMVGRYQLTSALTLLGLAFSTLFAAAGTDTAAGGDSLLAAGGQYNGYIVSKTGLFVTEEIQVYNAEIAKVGQWTLQFHFNYAIKGLKEPDFEGGIIPNHALNGTPELAYGVTEWWEIGFYAPYAMDQAGEFSSNAGKIRSLFVPPNAAKRDFFYGVNFEVSYATL